MAQRIRLPRNVDDNDLAQALYGQGNRAGLAVLAAAAAAAPRAAEPGVPPEAPRAVQLRGRASGRRVWRQTLFKVTINSQMAFADDVDIGARNQHGYSYSDIEELLRNAAFTIGRRATRALFVTPTTSGTERDIERVEVTNYNALTIERGGRMHMAHVQLNIVVTHYLHKTVPGSKSFGPRLDINVLRQLAEAGFRVASDPVSAERLARRLRFYIEVGDTPAGAHSYATKDAALYDDTLPPVGHGYEQTFPRAGWEYPEAFDPAVFNKMRRG